MRVPQEGGYQEGGTDLRRGLTPFSPLQKYKYNTVLVFLRKSVNHLSEKFTMQLTPDKLNLNGTKKKVQLIGRFILSEDEKMDQVYLDFSNYMHV